MEKTAFFHVDMDSPRTLMKFWGRDSDGVALDSFFDTAMPRALTLFKKYGLTATFFCIGEDLEASPSAERWVRKAFEEGHEIANHTFTHPYGLTRLARPALTDEIRKCSEAIERVTGSRPVGFRSPSCDIDNSVLRVLEEEKFLYDSSAWWNSLLLFMKGYHKLFTRGGHSMEFGRARRRIPRRPYYPDKTDWMRPSVFANGIVELPISRTAWLGLPFYSNFHLLAGEWYRRFSFAWMNQPQLIYLMHLIEFVDLGDGLPAELKVHTNVRKPAAQKIGLLDRSIRDLVKRYRPVRTDRFVREWKSR